MHRGALCTAAGRLIAQNHRTGVRVRLAEDVALRARRRGNPMISMPILGLSFLMGMQHALEADHIAAVSSITIPVTRRADIVKHGLTWGLWPYVDPVFIRKRCDPAGLGYLRRARAADRSRGRSSTFGPRSCGGCRATCICTAIGVTRPAYSRGPEDLSGSFLNVGLGTPTASEPRNYCARVARGFTSLATPSHAKASV
jgi:hypothetical protein